ncbi:hypothetical protein NP233_g671 [Leucocoprinus birnbaumii]|uniref:Uncharacterized protein n=1 Tax=Leucocoprinus birnbaumii TaxID=56174 RepID=A0AAD5W424_9AGAR|nr:hypothetical protein NP233_g671 [Leucocoprinus birnbaumii]
MPAQRSPTPYPAFRELEHLIMAKHANKNVDTLHDTMSTLIQLRTMFATIIHTAGRARTMINEVTPTLLNQALDNKQRGKAVKHIQHFQWVLGNIIHDDFNDRVMNLLVNIAEQITQLTEVEGEDKENAIARLLIATMGEYPMYQMEDEESSDEEVTDPLSPTVKQEEMDIRGDSSPLPLPAITPPPTIDEEVDHLILTLKNYGAPADTLIIGGGSFITWKTLQENGETNADYWKPILRRLLDNHHNADTLYRGTPIPLYSAGPDHARFFIGYKPVTDQFVIAPTKKKVAAAITH